MLKQVVQKFGDYFDFEPTRIEINSLADSIPNWLPFADTVEALKELKNKYKLAIISNIDNDLFAFTAKHLEVEFDAIITAEQAKSYKPSLNNFHVAFTQINLPLDQILHVAASIYNDIIPARSLLLATVWVNRKFINDNANIGENKPDLEVPDLQSLTRLAI